MSLLSELKILLNPFDEDESVGYVIERLRDLRGSTPREKTESIDNVLIPLLEFNRVMPIDADVNQYIPASAFEILLSDIHDSDVVAIESELGVSNMSHAENELSFPVYGLIYGPNLRLFIALTVKKRDVCKNVIFLIDTGSPYTFLAKETFNCIGFEENIPNATNVSVNGIGISVAPSHGHFANINLLGQNYMQAAGIQFSVNYKSRTLQLTQ